MANINPLWYVFFIESGIGFIFGILGLTLLLTTRQKKPSDMMLAHLTVCDIIYIAVRTVLVISILKGTFQEHRLIFRAVSFGTLIPQVMSLVIITIDRILAVNLLVRYKLVVTNKRLLVVLVCVWIFSAAYGVSFWFSKSIVYAFVALGLSTAVVLFFIVSYTYIIIKVHMTRRRTSTAGRCNQQSRFNYWIPFTIILTYVLFIVATDLSLVFTGFKFTAWHFIAWNLNPLADTITYVFGSARMRSRMRNRGRHSTTTLVSRV